MNETENNLQDIEIGFVRKSDGKIVNVKLFDVFKNFSTVDFVNNEIHINGETLIADSFRNPYYEVSLNIQKTSENGADGAFQFKGVAYTSNQQFTVEKGRSVSSTLLPNQNSRVKSVKDEDMNELQPVNNVVTLGMEKDHVISIAFDTIPVAAPASTTTTPPAS